MYKRQAIILTIIVTKIELALTNQRLVGRVGVVSRQIMDSKLDKVQTVDTVSYTHLDVYKRQV